MNTSERAKVNKRIAEGNWSDVGWDFDTVKLHNVLNHLDDYYGTTDRPTTYAEKIERRIEVYKRQLAEWLPTANNSTRLIMLNEIVTELALMQSMRDRLLVNI